MFGSCWIRLSVSDHFRARRENSRDPFRVNTVNAGKRYFQLPISSSLSVCQCANCQGHPFVDVREQAKGPRAAIIFVGASETLRGFR